VHKHPIKGQAALTALEPLHDVGLLIRAHHERFDGKGYPDGLKGDEIPLGARVLAVTDSYDTYLYDMLEKDQHAAGQARTYLLEERSLMFDPDVVDAYVRFLDEDTGGDTLHELQLNSNEIQPGMVLSKDLVSRDGILLFTRAKEITATMVNRLKALERDLDDRLVFHVLGE
ncbi:MAG: HD domain-containing protein, partial [Gammaproteobacteria bacterium]|nr:HD domain-containing protein [Gammaproteobacteria bacterium]